MLFCDEEELTALYGWIDDVEELSREKRNITRDFADGVMMAELVSNFIPRIVELHNYQPASSRKAKTSNWNTINKKILKKLKIYIPDNVIEAIVNGIPGVVEVVLIHVRNAILKITKPAGWDKKAKQEEEEEMEEFTPRTPPKKEPTDLSDSLLLGKKKKKKKKKKPGDAESGEGVTLPDISKKKTPKKKKPGPP